MNTFMPSSREKARRLLADYDKAMRTFLELEADGARDKYQMDAYEEVRDLVHAFAVSTRELLALIEEKP